MAEPDALFRAYIHELTYLKNAGADFARQHPKLARRLELGREGSADPQIERLLESFAFLSARLQREIDADFPRIPAALLGTLYPHLTAPVPSMAIARFQVDPEQSRASSGIEVPRETTLFATAEDGMTCRFRTCYPVTLWPLQVEDVSLISPRAVRLPAEFRQLDQAAAIIRIRIKCIGKSSFADFSPNKLRFYIDADHDTAETLFELLHNRVESIWLQSDKADLPQKTSAHLQSVGFARDEAVLPYPPGTHQGYRLLQEYFTFPQKYLFLDLTDIPKLDSGQSIDFLCILRSRPAAGLILEPDTLMLGCSPMINLFTRTSEPIRLDHTQTEYHLNPDMRQERLTEVYTVLSITDTAANAQTRHRIQPFYTTTQNQEETEPDCYWIARREPTGRADLPGSRMMLSFKHRDLSQAFPRNQVLFAQMLCTNRSVAEQIPAGTKLEIEKSLPVSGIVCQTRPSPQLSPPTESEHLWQLISHLSVNHLSLSGGDAGLSALKEILRLYGGLRGAYGHQMINALTAMETRPIARRIGTDAWRGFCHGLEVRLSVNDEKVGNGIYLFTAILSEFLGLYCGLNTFTQLVVDNPHRKEGVWVTWPPRSGDTILL